MGEPHVISAFMDERARILGDIEQAKDKLAELQDQLAHIDGTLRIFGTSASAEQKPIRTRARPRHFQQGELTRLLFTLLRERGPQTAVQLLDAVLERKALGGDPETREDVRKRVGQALARQEVRGKVGRGRAGGGGVVWQVPTATNRSD